MIEIYALKLTEQLHRPVENFLAFFSSRRQAEILRYRFSADRNRTLWTELLVRSALARKTSRSVQETVILRDERGKPYVAGNRLSISLSHSENWAVCSIGEVPNGIDVEEDATDAFDIAEHFFTAQEYQSLRSLDDSARTKTFLKFWTIKESYAKYTGQGIAEKFDKIDSGALLAGKGHIVGKNFSVGNGIIGLCAKKGTLPPGIVLVSRSFFDDLY